MATRRQSSRATDLQTNNPSSTSPPFDDTPAVFTTEPLEANTPSALNGTDSPHPIENRPGVNGHSRTRFTLHRILSAIIAIAFAVSKFSDSFHGARLTLSLLDLISAILGFILYVCSWYESDPPPYLRWLLDTDWHYLFDMSKQGAATVKKNPLATWSLLVVAFSILLSFTKAILLLRSHQAFDLLRFLSLECLVWLYIFMNVVLMVSGAGEHRGGAHKHAFITVVGVFTQLGSLAAWATTVLPMNDAGAPLNAVIFECLLGDCLILFTGRSAKLLEVKAVLFGLLSCALVSYSSFFAYFAKDISSNGGDLFSIYMLTMSTIGTLLWIGLLIYAFQL